MPDLDHPLWCVRVFCTIDRPPFQGHEIGAHRSAPLVVDATVLRLRQGGADAGVLVEIRRGDGLVVLPLVEAQSLAPTIDDLLESAGVGL